MKDIFATESNEFSQEILKLEKSFGYSRKPLVELGAELKETENKLTEILSSEEEYVEKMCKYLLKAQGKRLRPALVFLAGQFGDYNIKKLTTLAAAVEILHMATLVHDDIIDQADLRRGMPTIHKAWDQDTAILLGDYLYGKTLTLLSPLGEKAISSFSEIVTKLVEGEIKQKANLFNHEITLESYQRQIHNKTAFFISQCCYLGATICNGAPGDAKLLANFGNCLGLAFQIQDDLMDFTEKSHSIGKPVNEDLKRGLLTLPVIYALNKSSKKNELQEVIKSKDITDEGWALILEEINRTSAVDYSRNLARYYARKAREWIKTLPDDSPGKNSLEFLTYFVTERKK